MEELELYGIIFNPDYDKHKKGAPLVRNRKIVEHSDIIVAVWDSKSKGTKYAIDYAKKQRKPTFIYNENGKLIEAYDGN
jgi:nucleoside 2-deoxyribosyltransferase